MTSLGAVFGNLLPQATTVVATSGGSASDATMGKISAGFLGAITQQHDDNAQNAVADMADGLDVENPLIRLQSRIAAVQDGLKETDDATVENVTLLVTALAEFEADTGAGLLPELEALAPQMSSDAAIPDFTSDPEGFAAALSAVAVAVQSMLTGFTMAEGGNSPSLSAANDTARPSGLGFAAGNAQSDNGNLLATMRVQVGSEGIAQADNVESGKSTPLTPAAVQVSLDKGALAAQTQPGSRNSLAAMAVPATSHSVAQVSFAQAVNTQVDDDLIATAIAPAVLDTVATSNRSVQQNAAVGTDIDGNVVVSRQASAPMVSNSLNRRTVVASDLAPQAAATPTLSLAQIEALPPSGSGTAVAEAAVNAAMENPAEAVIEDTAARPPLALMKQLLSIAGQLAGSSDQIAEDLGFDTAANAQISTGKVAETLRPEDIMRSLTTQSFEVRDAVSSGQRLDAEVKSPTTPRFAAAVTAQIQTAEIGEGRTRIELSPAGLGTLEIDVTSDADGSLRIVVRAENPAVLSALQEERDLLAQIVGDTGSGSLEFQEYNRGSGQQDASQDQGQTGTAADEGQTGDADLDHEPKQAVIDGSQLDIVA